MEKITFDCNSSSFPAYACSKPGDNSGVYIRSRDVDDLLEEVSSLRELSLMLRRYGRDLAE